MPPLGAIAGLTTSTLSQAVGFGSGQAMAAALEPIVQDIRNALWRLHPSMPLPPDIAAQIALKRPELFGAMQTEAENSGYDNRAFTSFVDAMDNPPAVGELLEMLRRRIIDHDSFVAGLRDSLVPERWHTELSALQKILLSPADLAMARQQSFIPEGEQIGRSALQGVDAEDAELLFKLAGEPPGPETMVALWRRGHIDESRVRQAIVEGRIKLKYTDDILKLKHVPLSAAIAAEAVLRERHLPKPAHYYAESAGIDPADFDAWVDMMGRPIPVGEALTLARRGQFTFAQFKDAVARSDVRTEFADDLWKLREVLPTPLELRRMLAISAVTDDLATEIMVKRGYAPEISAGIVRAAHSEKTAKQRDLGASQVIDLYEAGFEPREWALEQLVNLGYDDVEAALEIDLTEAKRLIGYLKAALNRIKSSYVSHKVDESQTLDSLYNLGIDPDQAQNYLEIWDVEREAYVQRLTNAQIGKAYKLGLIEKDDAIARWIGNGYPQEDAMILAALAVNPGAVAPAPT